MSNLKPQLAEDAILDKVTYPCWAQPKIDGVRAMNLAGTLTGRSLDPFEGFGITDYFSGPAFIGLDGEMTLGPEPTLKTEGESLCALTTGAMGRFKGVTEMADLHWWIFDLVQSDTLHLPYEQRYAAAAARVARLGHRRVGLVPYEVCNNSKELQAAIAKHLDQGYEGTIIRNPRATYKEGRATKKAQELWRVKPWDDFEILVTAVIEGAVNTNEAKKNTLGRTERSSAQAGLVPSGEVGSIKGAIVTDVHCRITGRLLFPKGLEITAGSGKMTKAKAKHFFENQSEIVGHFAKIKHLAYGVKDLPRMPTYESLRLKQDMGEPA